MTATVDRPEAAAAGPAGAAETVDAPVPASVRVYLLAARKSLIPLTLPAEAPLGKVVEASVKVVNNRLTGDDALPERVVYEFGWIDGAVLSDKPEATLASCGVRDGDLLQLLPSGAAIRYVPRNESVASALAIYLRSAVNPVTGQTAHAVAVSTIIAAALGCAVLLWRTRLALHSGLSCAGALAAVAVVGWLATVMTARRWPEFPRVRDSFAVTSIVVSATALAAVPPKVGAPNVFVAAVTVSAACAVLARFTGRYWAACSAAIALGALTAIASGVSMFAPLSGFQLGVSGLVAALMLTTLAPKLGLTLARIPRQPFRSLRNRDMFEHAEDQPYDTVSPVDDDTPDPSVLSSEQVAAAATRARAVLVGVCVAVAAVQVLCAWLAVTPHTNSPVLTVLLVCAVAVELIVRARRFNDRVQAVLLVGSSTAALMAIGAKYAWSTPATDLSSVVVYAGCALIPAVVVFLVGTAGWQHLFSPNTRKAVEWLGYLLIVVIPLLAAWVLNIFMFLRTQGLHW